MKDIKELLSKIANESITQEPFYHAEIKTYYVTTEAMYESIKANYFVSEEEEYRYDDIDITEFRESKHSFAEKELSDLLIGIYNDISFPNVSMLPKLITDSKNLVLYSKKNIKIGEQTVCIDVKYEIYIHRHSIVNYDKLSLLNTIEAYNNMRIYNDTYGEKEEG